MDKTNKTVEKFIELILRLEPIEFIGLSKILCIKIVDDKMEPRPSEDIMCDMIDKFGSINRKKRKEILNIMKSAGKGWGK